MSSQLDLLDDSWFYQVFHAILKKQITIGITRVYEVNGAHKTIRSITVVNIRAKKHEPIFTIERSMKILFDNNNTVLKNNEYKKVLSFLTGNGFNLEE